MHFLLFTITCNANIHITSQQQNNHHKDCKGGKLLQKPTNTHKPSAAKHPDCQHNHIPPTDPKELEIIESHGNMTVTIIAAQVVHAFIVLRVGATDVIIPP